MYKNIILSLVFSIFIFSWLPVAFGVASANTISELRIQLQNVLNKIEKLKSELKLVENGLTATNGVTCVKLNSNLKRGMNNSEVKKLQIFLAQDKNIYPEAITTGYFGKLTELAVQRWQSSNGIISYGSPSTTGYGAVGPKTREVMSATCNSNNITGINNVVDFNLTNTSGKAPFSTTAQISMLESSCMSYKIDWGDRSEPTSKKRTRSTNCDVGIQSTSRTHIYNNSGEYVVTLYAGKSNDTNTLPKAKSIKITTLKGSPYVKVLYPSQGTSLRLGEPVTIKTQVSNAPEDSAIVFYIVGRSGTYKFAKRHTQGSAEKFNWVVGDAVCDGNGCNVQLRPGSTYKIRAAMYTPADACILDCATDSIKPTFLTNNDSGVFNLTQLGSSGKNPLILLDSTGKAPLTTLIGVELSPPKNGGIENFEVDLGDGSTPFNIHIPAGETKITKKTIPHTYTNTGIYNIRLRPVGTSQYISQAKIIVTEPNFTLTPNEGAYAPTKVAAKFDVDTSCGLTGQLTRTYTIDWRDGTNASKYELVANKCTSSSLNTQSITTHTIYHNYTETGSYLPRLTISNGTSYYKTTQKVTLTGENFTVTPSYGYKPLESTVSFKADESCVVGNATTITYEVDWGDGSTKSTYNKSLPSCGNSFSPQIVTRDFTHTFQNTGRYDVTLSIKKGNINSTYSKTKEVVVDQEVLRNGLRNLAQRINNLHLGESLATAIRSIFK